MKADLYEHVTMTLTWGCDEAQQVFEHLEARCRKSRRLGQGCPPPGAGLGGREGVPGAGSTISTKSNEPME